MKKIVLSFLIILFYGILCFAQEPKHIYLTFNKTVHLIFPKEIYYKDVGTSDILMDNKNAILKLAPKTENFEQTNLTVVTVDNVWYTFLLDYKKDITELTYFIKESEGRKVEGALVAPTDNTPLNNNSSTPTSKGNVNRPDSIQYILNSKNIISKPVAFWDVGAENKKVYLAINNIFINDEKLYFVVTLGNTSNINYDIEFIQLWVKSKKKLKKSSVQDIQRIPLFVYNNIQKLPAETKDYHLVFIYDKFTISDDQKLVFEMYEKKGGRKISFDIQKDLIINAVPIN